MVTKCKTAWIGVCAAAALLAGCDLESFDRVPEVGTRTEAGTSPTPSASGVSDDEGARAGEARDARDTELTTRVEAALDGEPDLHGARIGVRSADGVVTLSGTARDPQLRSMAAEVALSVEGVRRVRNEITLAQEA